jgi:hypothetical protein
VTPHGPPTNGQDACHVLRYKEINFELLAKVFDTRRFVGGGANDGELDAPGRADVPVGQLTEMESDPNPQREWPLFIGFLHARERLPSGFHGGGARLDRSAIDREDRERRVADEAQDLSLALEDGLQRAFKIFVKN